MKINVFLLSLIGAVSIQAADPFVAPDFVKELDALSEVKKKATKDNKGVTFLLMEPGST